MSNDVQTASWCGWHKDHGLLTALTSAMYLPATTSEQQNNNNIELEEQTCVDPNAGLHIKDRSCNIVKVSINRSDLAFQVGEVMQVLSGGFLQATPHAVIAPSVEHGAHVSRNTFAVFMQPSFDEVLDVPTGGGLSEVVKRDVEAWRENITFGNFARAKFERYYSGKQL